MTLTAGQIRQACALLGWKSGTLTRRSGISYAAAVKVKTDEGFTTLAFMDVWAIRTALEKAGVRFVWAAGKQPAAELRAEVP